MKNGVVFASLALLLSFGVCRCEEGGKLPSQLFNFTGDCIKIDLKLELLVTYEQSNNSNATIRLPGTNYSVGAMESCEEPVSLVVTLLNGAVILTLDFVTNGGNQSWNMSSLQVEYLTDYPGFIDPEYDGGTVNGDTNIEKIGWGRSYKCGRNNSFNLTGEETADGAVKVIFSYLQVQAFNFEKPGNFSSAMMCAALPGSGSKSDDKVVPIAVGCALAGLVVIVLIAYLIGRFRSRNTDSYQVLS